MTALFDVEAQRRRTRPTVEPLLAVLASLQLHIDVCSMSTVSLIYRTEPTTKKWEMKN